MVRQKPERQSPRLSIIVVSFNTCELLRNCLASIRTFAESEVEVIVVDNHSSDGSPEMVREEFAEVQLIRNTENLGFAKANNQGLKVASGNYLLLLNSDTIVRGGALRTMLEFLDANPRAGGVTCRLLNSDGSIQACVSNRPGPALLLFRLSGISQFIKGDKIRRKLRKWLGGLLGSTARSYLDPYTAKDPIEVENISGACLMLRRETIEQVGPLDENFFMYMEDMDYCMRIREAGWKLYYLPAGEIVHLVGQSSGGRMRTYSVHSYRSLLLFYRKHYSSLTVNSVRLAVLVASLFRWLWMVLRGSLSSATIYRQNRQDLAKVIRLCFG